MHIFECRILTNWCKLHFSCRHRHKNNDMCRTNIKGKRINNKQQTCQPSVLTKKYDNNNQRCRFGSTVMLQLYLKHRQLWHPRQGWKRNACFTWDIFLSRNCRPAPLANVARNTNNFFMNLPIWISMDQGWSRILSNKKHRTYKC